MRHLPEVRVRIVKQEEQRYNTPDDYYKKGNEIMVNISEFDNKDYEFLMLIHGLVEWYLTEKRGIKEEIITNFDKKHPELDDPGCDKNAPYHKEHMFAEKMEKLIAKELKTDWKEYCNNFLKVMNEGRKNAI